VDSVAADPGAKKFVINEERHAVLVAGLVKEGFNTAALGPAPAVAEA
jgi:hypothetical protein